MSSRHHPFLLILLCLLPAISLAVAWPGRPPAASAHPSGPPVGLLDDSFIGPPPSDYTVEPVAFTKNCTPGHSVIPRHYYRFEGQADLWYRIETKPEGQLDTLLRVYRVDPIFNPHAPVVAENDDWIDNSGATPSHSPGSRIDYYAPETGSYWVVVEIKNTRWTNNDKFCLNVWPLTPQELGSDSCEPNDRPETACLLSPTQSAPTSFEKPAMNFQPATGLGPDRDYFRFHGWRGWEYICETTPDYRTNTILRLYDHNMVMAAENTNYTVSSPTNLGSRVTYTPREDGWVTVLVESAVPIPINEGRHYTYNLKCTGKPEADNQLEVGKKCSESVDNSYQSLVYNQTTHYHFFARRGIWYTAKVSGDGKLGLRLFVEDPRNNPAATAVLQKDNLGKEDRGVALDYSPPGDMTIWLEVRNLDTAGIGKHCSEVMLQIMAAGVKDEPNDSFVDAKRQSWVENKFTIDKLNFMPLYGNGPDLDYFIFLVPASHRLECNTDSTSVATVMRLYDSRERHLADSTADPANPLKSTLVYTTTTLSDDFYLQISSLHPIFNPRENGNQFEYDLKCSRTYLSDSQTGENASGGDATPEPHGEPENAPSGVPDSQAASDAPAASTGSQTTAVPTPWPMPHHAAAAPFNTPEPVAGVEAASATPLPPAAPVAVAAVPGFTALGLVAQEGTALQTLVIQVYYDANGNGRRDAGEGIGRLPLYLSTAGRIQSAITDDNGTARLMLAGTPQMLRLSIPYLHLSREIHWNGSDTIQLRLAP